MQDHSIPRHILEPILASDEHLPVDECRSCGEPLLDEAATRCPRCGATRLDRDVDLLDLDTEVDGLEPSPFQ